jgi:hypothetical protein
MVKRGIYFTNQHNHFINYALSDDDINTTVQIALVDFCSGAFGALHANRRKLWDFVGFPYFYAE